MISLKDYYKEIYHSLPAPRKKRKRYLKDLEESVTVYLEQHGEAKREDIEKRFGTPGEIVSSFFAEANEKEINKHIVNGKWIKRIVFAGVVCVVIVAIIFYSVEFAESYRARRGHFGEEIIESYHETQEFE